VNIIEGIELGVAVATTYVADLNVLNNPTPPIRVGSSWYTVTRVTDPNTVPSAPSDLSLDANGSSGGAEAAANQ
jgi:hypothetical protein